VRDPTVTEADQVLDRQCHRVVVGGADDVHAGVVHVPAHRHQRHPSGHLRHGHGWSQHHQGVEAEVLK
jgi:hypothetical protein